MTIKLHPLFAVKWRRGYLEIRAKGRRYLQLRGYNGESNSIPYARYLMCCHLGRMLGPDETVDHIDEDPSNDDMANLQILSMRDNVRKSARKKSPPVERECKKCGAKFFVRAVVVKRGNGIFCSTSCAAKVRCLGRKKYAKKSELPHGSVVCYSYHKCRCDKCRQAQADMMRKRRQRINGAASVNG